MKSFYIVVALLCLVVCACSPFQELVSLETRNLTVGKVVTRVWSTGTKTIDVQVSNSFRHKQEWDEWDIRFHGLADKSGNFMLKDVE